MRYGIRDLFGSEEASAWDEAGEIPKADLDRLARAGWMSGFGSGEGEAWSALELGERGREVGQLSFSLLSVLVVHGMYVTSLCRWGTEEQKDRLLPAALKGERLGAFALTEPEFGSDAAAIQLEIRREGNELILNGKKQWISNSGRASDFLVMGSMDDKPCACLVPRETPGFGIQPMSGLMGFRAAMIGELCFENCRVPAESLLGHPGGGISHVAAHALDLGRYLVAWGCLGIMEAATTEAVSHARKRVQFDKPLDRHQLVQGMISDMITGVRATRSLCKSAAEHRENESLDSVVETTVAKYFASRQATQVTSYAVQVLGARGCSSKHSPVERFYRDARIAEIIEGSSQMQQLMISRSGSGEFLRLAKKLKASPKA